MELHPIKGLNEKHKYFLSSSSSLPSQDQSSISWLDKQARKSVIIVTADMINEQEHPDKKQTLKSRVRVYMQIPQ